MTRITPFAAGTISSTRTTTQLLGLKSQLDVLNTQLSTGRTAQTYGGLGTGRTTSLSAHARLTALDGYDTAITYGQTRTKLASASLSQIVSLGTSLRSNLSTGSVRQSNGIASSAQLARNDLDAALDALNQSDAGGYLFGGRDSQTRPVLDTATILSGDASDPAKPLAGLKTLITEQVRADTGLDGKGRLTRTQPSTTSVALSEDASAQTRANFGFRLAGAPAVTGSALTASYTPATAATATAAFQAAPTEGQRFRVVVNQPDGSQKTIDFTARANPGPNDTDTFPITGSPAAAKTALDGLIAPGTLASVQSATPTDSPPGPGLSLTFTGGGAGSLTVGLGTPPAQPTPGDTVTITLALHDGTRTTLTLTAKSPADATSPGDFAIDPSGPAGTATNIAGALDKALASASATTLTAAATTRASQDFFAGSTATGLAPRRITFDAGGNATGYSQTPRADTVIWYRGEDSGTSARDTATLRVGDGRSVSVGARANEPGIRSVLAGLASVALGTPTGTGTDADAAWSALASRANKLLGAVDTSPSVQEIVTDLSLASNSLSTASETNKATRNTLQSSLDGVETVSTEEVAAKLLEVQNRLQASYQVTSSLSKLSLVNYLG